MARKKGRSCIKLGLFFAFTCFACRIPVAEQCLGKQQIKGFSHGPKLHWVWVDGELAAEICFCSVGLFMCELAGFVLKACPKPSVWMKSFLYSTSIMVELVLPWCISNSRSEKPYTVQGEISSGVTKLTNVKCFQLLLCMWCAKAEQFLLAGCSVYWNLGQN